MKQRTLGDGLRSSAVGLGCMTMIGLYGKADDAESIRAIHRAVEIGMNFIDTSDAYGNGKNEELVGKAIAGRRDKVVLATKFGNIRTPEGKPGADGRPEYVREACEKSLKRLGVEVIDLYFQHRVDASVPIEDTVGAMADLVRQGKVRHLGLSEAGAETVRRAAATHPIAALQTEYSLWTRDVESELLPLCRSLGIGFVAYSPLGRGFLTGAIASQDDLADDDRRREHPRFAAENIAANARLLPELKRIADAKGATPAQVAIAWVLAQGEDIVPIPGTKRAARVEENAAAADLALSDDEIARLSAAFPPGVTAGQRYPAGQLKMVGL